MKPITETFADAYYAAVRSSELRAAPMQTTIGGLQIVLFRDAAGHAHALRDRCGHRGVPLSAGRVAGDCIVCPYHGWQYDRDGACRSIPELSAPHRVPARARVQSYPCIERKGWVFVCIGSGEASWPAPELPELDQGYRAFLHAREVQCHWSLMVENVLDGAHLPFIHKGSLERGGLSFDWSRRFRSSGAEPGEYQITDLPNGFIAAAEANHDGRELRMRFRVQLPSTVTVELDFGTRSVRVFVHVVPVAPGSCRVEHAILRNFARSAWVDPLFGSAARRILLEDSRAVELQQKSYSDGYTDFEVSTIRDRIPLHFRRRVRQGASTIEQRLDASS